MPTYAKTGPLKLTANIAEYVNTKPLRGGQVKSELVSIDFTGPKVANQGFKPMIREGKFDTGYIARHHAELGLDAAGIDNAAAARGALHLLSPRHQENVSPWDATDGFQLSGPRKLTLPIVVNGNPDMATVDFATGRMQVSVHGETPDMEATLIEALPAVYVLRGGRQTIVALADHEADDADHVP